MCLCVHVIMKSVSLRVKALVPEAEFQERHRASLVQHLTSGQFPTITYPLRASFILFGLKDNDCLVSRIIFMLQFILIWDFQNLAT